MTLTEQRRMELVARMHVLDTPPEAAFDRITTLAAELFDVPIALVTIVAEDRIWFKSRAGLDVTEIGRESGLCASAIEQTDVWVVEDARADERTMTNSLVTGDLGLQFYAGAPLHTSDAGALGTLCLISHEPRLFTDQERRRLRMLADVVVELVQLRAQAMSALTLAEATRMEDAATSATLQAELERRRVAEEQQRLLSDVSSMLLTTDDLDAAMSAAADRALPMLGQGCAISMLDEHGFRTSHVTALDPTAITILGEARDVSEQLHLDQTPSVLQHVFDTNQPLVCTVDAALTWPGMPDSPELRAALEQFGAFQFLMVPMLSRNRPVGAITFVATDAAWAYRDLHIQTATDLASRLGAAIENERLHQVEARIADALQGSLLPAALPNIPGLDIAARYRAAGPSDIGGDFYDLFNNDGPGWTLLLGDVSGKGPEAAAIAGLARYTARALALTDTAPSQILTRLNTAVQRQSVDSKFLTAICARIVNDGDVTRIELADAGHVPAIVRRADATVEILELRGTLLGIFPEATIDTRTIELRPGDTCVLYTDGAVEARNADGQFLGVEGLAGLVQRSKLRKAANIANRLLTTVEEFDRGQPHDDIALLVLRARENDPSPSRSSTDEPTPATAT